MNFQCFILLLTVIFLISCDSENEIKHLDVFGVQEAINDTEKEDWKPIEVMGFDFCGNGRWGLVVHPKEFIVVLMRKYSGDYETEIRTKFKIGNTFFVSEPFQGEINESQFTMPNHMISFILE